MNCPMFLSVLFGGFLLMLHKPLPPHRYRGHLYWWGPLLSIPHAPRFLLWQFGCVVFFVWKHLRLRSEGHIHVFSRAEKLVGRLETAEHPAQEPPTYCLCSRRRIKCTQREVVFISGMKVQWRMCVTIAACWWGSRFIVSAAWPVEPVIKSNVWWVPHSSPWLQNQLNGSIYFIYWINSILLCNRAHR